MIDLHINPEEALQSSFRNFHSKSLDYICLKRSSGLTSKVYLFDGDASKLPEIVNPHDHRYDFETLALHGSVVDQRFRRSPRPFRGARGFIRYSYLTPLNGGKGFDIEGHDFLYPTKATPLTAEAALKTASDSIHTLKIHSDQAALLLTQFEDLVPESVPTHCWALEGSAAPSLSGLYDRFRTPGELVDRLRVLERSGVARIHVTGAQQDMKG